MQRLLSFLLPLLAVFPSGCGRSPFDAEPGLMCRFLFDTTDGSGLTEASAGALVDAVLPEVVLRRGTMEFFALDETEGAVLLGRFVVGTPAKESKSFLAAFERDRLGEGQRTFVLLRGALMARHPRTSPLALALTVMSTNAPKGAEVRYYLASDAREWTPGGVDMECHPPSSERWSSYLSAGGLLPSGSLRGASVVFVGVRPLMNLPSNRCAARLSIMNQTRSLWAAAITNAGGKAFFARDNDDLPGLAVLLFFGGGVLAWRKARVKARAKRDRKQGQYAFLTIIMELIGPKSGLDVDDPEHEQALARVDHLRVLVKELQARLRSLREELANHVRWVYLTGSTLLCGITEGVAWVLIYRDAGVPAPERYLVGMMSGFFYLILVMFATKHAETTGRRTWFILSVSVAGLIAVAATAVRVKNAMATGGELWEEACLGALLLCAALGPALASEYLMRPLRAVLPIVRLRREIKKQLRESERDLKQVTSRLAVAARLRRAWEWEYAVLKAVYDGENPPPNEHVGNNGPGNSPLPGGASWPDSASSSMRWSS